MEPMVIAGSWDLATDIPGHHNDRKDPGNVLVCIVLDCTRFIPDTYEHVHLYGPKYHGWENEDAGPIGLRVLFHAEVPFPSDTS